MDNNVALFASGVWLFAGILNVIALVLVRHTAIHNPNDDRLKEYPREVLQVITEKSLAFLITICLVFGPLFYINLGGKAKR